LAAWCSARVVSSSPSTSSSKKPAAFADSGSKYSDKVTARW
jgi:hypothetical protein